MAILLRLLTLFALAIVFTFADVAPADAGRDKKKYEHEYEDEDDDDDEDRYKKRGKRRGYEKRKVKRKYKDGDCEYEYEEENGKVKEKYKCKRRRGRAYGPPPWAPAHGYRWQHREPRRADTAVVVTPEYRPPFDLDLSRCNRETLGAVLGGAAGGILGSKIGKGDGRTVAIIGGTVLGVLVGGSIGRSMDDLDQNCVGQVLEHAPDGEAITWDAPRGDTSHQVTPTSTYQDQAGRYCREYQANSVIGGRQQQTYGTACRQPDGSWQLIN